MKLLGWMHRKFRQNSGDVFTDFASVGGTCSCLSSGRPSPDEYHHHHRSYYSPKPQRERVLLHRTKPEEFSAEEEERLENPFLFAGFLTIGTLGTVPIQEEEEEEEEALPMDAPDEDNLPSSVATPTFGVATKPVVAMVEAITEKQAEVTTAEDLVVVISELEKVLAAEAEKETSSAAGRASSARPSIASVKAWASPERPLQGYLFGSPVGVAEMAAARREGRASLEELFMRSYAAEDEERRNGVEEGGEEKAAEAAKRTKFQKVLKIFNRKVHPQKTIEAKKSTKPCKKRNNDHTSHEGGSCTGCCGAQSLKRTYSEENSTPNFKCHSVAPSSLSLTRSDSNGNLGHWIKTDTDYLVLEL